MYSDWSISLNDVKNVKIDLKLLSEVLDFQAFDAQIYLSGHQQIMVKVECLQQGEEVHSIKPINTIVYFCGAKEIHPNQIFTIECEPCQI